MSVYVDTMEARFGRMIMCHMTADTTAELLDMAKRIGVNPKWLQHPGSWKEHFDICLSKRNLALQAGAIQVTVRQGFDKLWAKRQSASGPQ